jgi:hypothetical protein
VPEFVLQFDPAEIVPLATRFGYLDESPCTAAGEAARMRGHYARDEFLLICEWKSARSRPKVSANDDARVQEATRVALGSDSEELRMTALLSLNGVGAPTASTLLHFAFPDRYPILDVRALESLGVRGRSTYPVAFWLEYLEACRTLSTQHAVDLRTLDKALWQYSKELRPAAT